jgi:hypothetical protein
MLCLVIDHPGNGDTIGSRRGVMDMTALNPTTAMPLATHRARDLHTTAAQERLARQVGTREPHNTPGQLTARIRRSLVAMFTFTQMREPSRRTSS